MNFEELKIGYVPYSTDLSLPGDRRRFPYFAKRNHVKYEIADLKNEYDVILLTALSNLSLWLSYKKKHPHTLFIFEMVDSLILTSDIFRILFKGIGRFLLRNEKRLYLNYKTPIKKWLSIADLIICSSTHLAELIQKWNKNVIVSYDYLQSEYRLCKNSYEIDNKMKLVWEGQGVVLPQLLYFKNVFYKVNQFCELHIITSDKYDFLGKISKRDISKITRQLPINTIFHKWEIETKDEILGQCDCGIIPLNNKNDFAWHKPANKLVSFWFSGLPALVSNTPAYTKLMKAAGGDLCCSETKEWVEKINRIKDMTALQRKELAQKNQNFVNKNFSDEVLDKTWFSIFKKITDAWK